MSEKIVQTAGRAQLGDFAAMFAHLNDDVLFGEVWNEDAIDVKTKCIITVVSLMASGITDSSLTYHLQNAKAHGVSKEEIAAIITHSPEFLRLPPFITPLQRFSDHYYSAEAGVDMPAGQLWSWIFFLTSLHHNQERILDGSDTLHLRFQWYLLPHCSLLRLAISNGLCSGHLLLAISLIMLWALHSHLRLRITEHFVNIYLPSLYY